MVFTLYKAQEPLEVEDYSARGRFYMDTWEI